MFLNPWLPQNATYGSFEEDEEEGVPEEGEEDGHEEGEEDGHEEDEEDGHEEGEEDGHEEGVPEEGVPEEGEEEDVTNAGARQDVTGARRDASARSVEPTGIRHTASLAEVFLRPSRSTRCSGASTACRKPSDLRRVASLFVVGIAL